MPVALESMLNVRPSGDDGAENHEPKREERHSRDRSPKPQNLSVSDQDDCEIFEDGVNRY